MIDSSLQQQADFVTPSLTVSELNRLARDAIEHALPLMWVSGEVSNFVRASSGHVYFTLKDDAAQVKCVMWRPRVQLLPFLPTNGMRVRVHALPTLYESRGDFQLSIETMRPFGAGDLHEAFLRLKQKLTAEGLFDLERKRHLPRFPLNLGIVSSLSASALQDVLTSLRRRAPHLPIIIYPSTVQGNEAGAQLRQAVSAAVQRVEQDQLSVLMLVRGGGSLEDLWAFNDEGLVRALADCPIPTVSGVGHETDFTLTDFVADVRAPTPTAAAELVSQGFYALTGQLSEWQFLLSKAVVRQQRACWQRLDQLSTRLLSPYKLAEQKRARAAQLSVRLNQCARMSMNRHREEWRVLRANLRACVPDIDARKTQLEMMGLRLSQGMRLNLDTLNQRLQLAATQLEMLDPSAVLSRGYAIVRGSKGQILKSPFETAVGERIHVTLHEGELAARVEKDK